MASTLSSASTLQQVLDSYDDNASYAEDGSIPKCKAFATACRIILRRRPKRARAGGASGQGEEIELDLTLIQKELDKAEAWLSTNGGTPVVAGAGGGGYLHVDLRDFRG
jgi:hypothetical protein